MLTPQGMIWRPYCGAAPSPGELLARWNFDPLLLLLLASAAFGYLRLVPPADGARRGRAACAFFLLFLLFVSPFCALTSALFSARVIHHVLLSALVAPLLVAALARPPRRFGSLAAWTAVQALVFWLWHSPNLYASALSNAAVYWLMQITLLGSAVGFWIAVRKASAPAAAGALLATMVQMGLLGALITFSESPLYAPHLASTQSWGYAPLEDQQLAGLIMWAPAAGLYLAAALLLLGRWFSREARLSGAT